MLSPGTQLSDRYRLDERIAIGGMGEVWRGTDVALGREVAVKILLPALLTDPTFIARFRAEARMMAALRHPGVVQVFDCGEAQLPAGGRADYLVMEYVNGEPLSRRIEAAGRLSIVETLSVVAQTAQALHAAHLGGIVHRDVKPSNLLVQPDGTVVLVDFGVARFTTMTGVTSANAVPGTALYMAPEQASGRPVSPATDIYALGAVGYCCLAGSPPFTGDSPVDVAVRHVHDEPPPLPADIPAPVAALIGRALAKHPANRYPSAAAFADAARAAAGGLPMTGSGARTLDGLPVTPMTPARGLEPVQVTYRDDSGGALTAVVDMSEGRPAEPAGRRGLRATVAGVVVAAVVLLAGLTALFGLGLGGGQPTTPTPSIPVSAAPATPPTDSETGPSEPTERTDDSDGGARATQPSRTRSASAKPSKPAASQSAQPPTTEPTPTPSPTRKEPTPPPAGTPPPAPPPDPLGATKTAVYPATVRPAG